MKLPSLDLGEIGEKIKKGFLEGKTDEEISAIIKLNVIETNALRRIMGLKYLENIYREEKENSHCMGRGVSNDRSFYYIL